MPEIFDQCRISIPATTAHDVSPKIVTAKDVEHETQIEHWRIFLRDMILYGFEIVHYEHGIPTFLEDLLENLLLLYMDNLGLWA